MIIKQQAKNGQVVNGLKKFDELTEEEYNGLTEREQTSLKNQPISELKNYLFQVRYNKHGKFLGIMGGNYSDTDESKETSDWQDFDDGLAMLFGNRNQAGKAHKRLANKHADVPSVREARRALKTLQRDSNK